MCAVYEKQCRLTGTRIGELFTLLHDVALEHQRRIDPEDCVKKMGLLWIVTLQRLELLYTPRAGEQLIVRTWLGASRHDLLPRHYEMRRADGVLVCRATAYWALLDGKARTLAHLTGCNFPIPACNGGETMMTLRPLRPVRLETQFSFTVGPEHLDGNGHMNNARYFDVVEELLHLRQRRLTAVQADYHTEALLGDQLTLAVSEQECTVLVQGKKEDTLRFRMKLEYAT